MKKQLVIGLLIVIGLLVVAPKVRASEGVINLKPVDSGSSCYALSIYVDNRYEVEGACRGLVVPYSAEQTYYLLWSGEAVSGKDDVNWKRQTEVERGKFSVVISDKFHFLQITAELDWSPRKPSGSVVARGSVEAIPLVDQRSEIKDQFKQNDTRLITPTPTPSQAPAAKATTGSLFGAILKVLGTGLLILIGLVVVMGVVTRRKGY